MVVLIVLLLASALPALAQPRGVGVAPGQRSFGPPRGVNVPTGPMFPHPAYSSFVPFAQRLGSVIAGYPAYTGSPLESIPPAWIPQRNLGFGLGGPVVFPIPFPVVGAGFAAPPVTYVINQPPLMQANPSIIVNKDYQPPAGASPVLRDYTNAALPESPRITTYEAPGPAPLEVPSNTQPILYLIALRDGTVLTAIAYWLEGPTLHYVQRDAKQASVPLDKVDRELSLRLNAERRVDFRLPANP